MSKERGCAGAGQLFAFPAVDLARKLIVLLAVRLPFMFATFVVTPWYLPTSFLLLCITEFMMKMEVLMSFVVINNDKP